MKSKRIGSLFLLMLLLSACAGRPAVTYELGAGDATVEELRVVSVSDEPEIHAEMSEPAEEETVCIYICGAVHRPDVYELPAGSRVYEAVAAAGGMTDEADPAALNLAEPLSDGQQITVYTREEVESGASPSATNAEKDEKVNLNRATKEQLMTLPGIGDTRAEAILQYREENGAFSSIEDICEISGIGEKSFEKLKNRITV